MSLVEHLQAGVFSFLASLPLDVDNRCLNQLSCYDVFGTIHAAEL